MGGVGRRSPPLARQASASHSDIANTDSSTCARKRACVRVGATVAKIGSHRGNVGQ